MTTHLDLGWLDPGLRGLRRQEAGPGTGLSRAIAARLGVDVVLVRVAFALLALSGGIGVALYLWGSALTPGRDGIRPIDAHLPTFATWSRLAQQATVVGSSLALVMLVSSATPLPWGPGVLLLGILVLARRGKLGGRAPAPGAPAAPAATHPAAESDDHLVARWRSTMEAAAGQDRLAASLPVVDLYSPAPARPQAPRPPAAWGTGAGILGVAVVSSAAAFVLLGSVPAALGSGMVTAGLLTVGYALVTRERRVPRPLLIALVAGMAASGWLSTQAAGELTAPDPGVLTVKAVADSRVIDLTDTDFTDITELRVEAVASDVTVLLPAWPTGGVADHTNVLSEVTLDPAWPSERGRDRLDVDVIVDATLSRVRIEE